MIGTRFEKFGVGLFYRKVEKYTLVWFESQKGVHEYALQECHKSRLRFGLVSFGLHKNQRVWFVLYNNLKGIHKFG